MPHISPALNIKLLNTRISSAKQESLTLRCKNMSLLVINTIYEWWNALWAYPNCLLSIRKAGASKLPAEEMMLRTMRRWWGGGGEDQMGRSPIAAPSRVDPMGADGGCWKTRKDVWKRNLACFCICRTFRWAFLPWRKPTWRFCKYKNKPSSIFRHLSRLPTTRLLLATFSSVSSHCSVNVLYADL